MFAGFTPLKHAYALKAALYVASPGSLRGKIHSALVAATLRNVSAHTGDDRRRKALTAGAGERR